MLHSQENAWKTLKRTGENAFGDASASLTEAKLMLN